EVLKQDFRGTRPTMPLDLTGRDASAFTRTDDGGFRITLPAQRESSEAVGLFLRTTLQGDFDIICGYELIEADRPKSGWGVGFEFYTWTETPTKEAIAFSRYVRAEEGDVFLCSRMTTVDGRRRYNNRTIPAPGKSGKMR